MTAPVSIGLSLQHLLAALSRQSCVHLTEVDTDLRQTSYLLVQAIEKLGNSFMGIHQALASQHALIDAMRDGEVLTPALRVQFSQLQQQAATHVNSAVTGLQFQDMTSQLIGRVAGHAGALRDLFENIAARAALLPGASGTADVQVLLDGLSRTLDENGEAQMEVARKTVAQTHMESGDIELF